MALPSPKLTVLLAGAAALVAALPAAQKSSSSNQTAAGATTPVSTPVPTPAAAVQTKTRFGVNLAGLAEWTNERAFMNLLAGSRWQDVANGWAEFNANEIDGGGNITRTGGMNVAAAMSMPPRARTGDVPIRCTYQGNGSVSVFAGYNVNQSAHVVTFTFPKLGKPFFLIGYSNPADPVRNIDCREADADAKAVFDPDFIATIKPFNTIRFLDWQLTNDNRGGDWSKRTLPGGTLQSGPDGVAVENMVALANTAHVNPWFTLPFNADATYVENFARYVHDNLDKSLVAYVEIGNEVWNWQFGSAQQALSEGLRLKLSDDGNVARMQYYAQKMNAAMTIWERVYASDPQRLVRVAGGQAVWPDLLGIALEYKDTASHIDALAFAPYFGYDLDFSDKNLDVLFPKISAAVDSSIGFMKADRTLATKFGKRMVVYEAGQHLANGDTELMGRIMRDERMGDMYRKYMRAWDANGGDLMNLFNTTFPIGAYAWGLMEYSGQPLSETPKRRAALDMIKEVGSR